MKREIVVSSIGFDEHGLEVAYMVLPDDVRSEGHLVLSRSLAISFQGPDGLGSLAVDLQGTVVDLVAKAHDLLDTLPVHDPPAVEGDLANRFPSFDDDDEDVGMGDGR